MNAAFGLRPPFFAFLLLAFFFAIENLPDRCAGKQRGWLVNEWISTTLESGTTTFEFGE
jgi:hypothetical protein